jgi:hypothetical protein
MASVLIKNLSASRAESSSSTPSGIIHFQRLAAAEAGRKFEHACSSR